MIFRQLFEAESSTYTYLIGCTRTRQAALVDPVLETFPRDLDLLAALELTLAYTLDTHIHADHVSGALKCKVIAGSKIAMPAAAGLTCADVMVSEGSAFTVGDIELMPLFTPGHTDHHHCYLFSDGPDKTARQAVLSGDCLLIDGCGRTDFQSGSAAALYRSVREKLFTLPDDTLVYPGHDYQARRVSSIAQERTRNPRLKDGISEAAFIKIMAELNLAYPKKIDIAVPANEHCGQCADTAPESLKQLCDMSIQG